MTDALDGVREHYRATGLTERLKIALTVLGPEDQPLTPQQLGAPTTFTRMGLLPPAILPNWPESPPTCRYWTLDETPSS
ncbi:hypothetical protein [Paraburkholderia solitsugae]|uniref:hypothetical protein n=1 Tax=Paraburkholderia solitsugae TaxID=2675748 RepID=UPI001F491AD4|nr:hypothetical protein [Paraburkholderia solitsugae]